MNNQDLAHLIEKIELVSIELIELKLNNTKTTEESASFGIGVRIKHTIHDAKRNNDQLTIPCSFQVKARPIESKQDLFNIRFSFNLLYSLDGEFEDDIIEKFAKTSAPLNVWPFARELTSTLTTRMGFPPLMFPLWKTSGQMEWE